MADVLDVAEKILREAGPTDTFRLQKLVYYAQACHLARHDKPLFDAPIKAWVNGPVVPELFQAHKGAYKVTTVGGDPANLSNEQADSIEMALRLYGGHNSTWLVAQTHAEPPWLDARRGLAPDAPASPRIDIEEMRKYYGVILNDPEIEAALTGGAADDGMTASQLRERFSA